MKLVHNRIVRLLVIVGSLFLIINLPRSIYDLLRKRGIVVQQEGELRKIREENSELARRLTEAQTPQFVERAAREKLGLVRDREIIVLLPPQAAATASGLVDRRTNWKKWWELFF